MNFSADLTPERITRAAESVFKVNEIKRMKVVRLKNASLTDHDRTIISIGQSSSSSGILGLHGK